MNGAAFIRRVRQIGKERSVDVHFERRQGKGSHGRLYYGSRFTTIKDRKKELGKGLRHAMIQQLKLKPEDF